MLSYHAVLHAMEARSGLSSIDRLWMAVRHSLDGHLPYARYHQAGLRRDRAKSSVSNIERSVVEWLATDINPSVQGVRLGSSLAMLIVGYNAYNASACVAVKTRVEAKNGGGETRYVARRELIGTELDPESCKVGALAVFETLIRDMERRLRAGVVDGSLTISMVAQRLGVEWTASAEAAAVFERRGHISIPELARELGCGQRTLERQIKEEGGNAESIRSSARMVTATRMLSTNVSLTEVALSAGFSDSAHMSRSVKVASGLTPSVLRKIMMAQLSRTGELVN